MPLALNEPQGQFLSAQKKFNAFVGGYRSGKTFVGCVRLWTLAARFPGIKLGYFAPTYPMISDIFYSTITEVGEALSDEWGISLSVDLNISRKEVTLFIGGVAYAMVKCRSMEHPHRIVGFDINHAQIDEIDTMKKDKADAAWKKIIARLSSVREDYPINTVDFTTTPEGFNFVYELFVKRVANEPGIAGDYSLIKASTRKNAKNLPADYIPSLYNTYPANLVDAYIDGEFVNLTSGTVYPQFDRTLNACNDEHDGREPVHIGMDFNVGKMSAIIHVERQGEPRAVGEILGAYDTPDMIRLIKQRLWRELSDNEYEETCQIYVYPDASGNARKTTNASTSDLALLRDAGFVVMVRSKNPSVRDRITSVNAMFCNAQNERRYLINVHLCPQYAEAREQQVYNKNGEPDKSHDKDHPNDAGDYYIHYAFPAHKPSVGWL